MRLARPFTLGAAAIFLVTGVPVLLDQPAFRWTHLNAG